MGWIRISGTVVGADVQAQNILASSYDIADRLRAAMQDSADRMRADVLSAVTGEFQRRTGKMQRAVYGFAKDDGQVFVGYAGVGKRAFYAKFQERGVVPRLVKVKGYSRSHAAGDIRAGGKKIAAGIGFVKPYERTMHLDQHALVHAVFGSLWDTIRRDIERAVRGG